jgi:hypothetical protein
MFYPPASVDLSHDQPKPRPVYDNPPVIVRHRPVRAFVARVAARNSARHRASRACPEPRPESSL